MVQESMIWEQLGVACDRWQEMQVWHDSPVAFLRGRAEREQLEQQIREELLALGAQLVSWVAQGGTLSLRHEEAPRVPLIPAREAEEEEAAPLPPAQVTLVEVRESSLDPSPEPVLPPREDSPPPPSREALPGPSLACTLPPAPVPPPRPTAKGEVVPLDADRLAKLRLALEQGGFKEERDDAAKMRQALEHPWEQASAVYVPTLLSELGSPRKLTSAQEIKQELGTLRRATQQEHVERWAIVQPQVVRALLQAIVARARAMQEPSCAHHVKGVSVKEEVADIFQIIQRYMLRHHPGFIYGLALDHGPRHGSWAQDAVKMTEELRQVSAPYLPEKKAKARRKNPERALLELRQALTRKANRVVCLEAFDEAVKAGVSRHDTRLQRLVHEHAMLREALRERGERVAAPQDDEREDEQGVAPIDEAWSWRDYIHGKEVIMVGGQPQEVARQRVARHFEPASLEWVELSHASKMRQVQKHCKRIAQGNVDLVIVIKRFISHKASMKIHEECKKRRLPIVYVEQGYGITRIRSSIEEQLVARTPGAADSARLEAV